MSSGPLSSIKTAPDEPRTLNERIYLQLREDILNGKLSPGTKLRFEMLKTMYAAGTSTLRESLSRLAAENLVVGEGQRGFTVAPVSLGELHDLTRTRQDLESIALRRSIEQGDDDWEAAVLTASHLLSKMTDPATGRLVLLPDETVRRHRAFHLALVSACLLHFIRLLYDQSERYRRFSTLHATVPRDTAAEHRELVEATLGRNADRAERLLREHLEHTAEVVTAISASWDGGKEE
jgi:GntR family transcriptional regulator, carbon starvation induced regulator